MLQESTGNNFNFLSCQGVQKTTFNSFLLRENTGNSIRFFSLQRSTGNDFQVFLLREKQGIVSIFPHRGIQRAILIFSPVFDLLLWGEGVRIFNFIRIEECRNIFKFFHLWESTGNNFQFFLLWGSTGNNFNIFVCR